MTNWRENLVNCSCVVPRERDRPRTFEACMWETIMAGVCALHDNDTTLMTFTKRPMSGFEEMVLNNAERPRPV